MADVDFMHLRREITAAARKAFSALRAEKEDERFYAFALYSDDDASTVRPSANTVEGFDRCVERYKADQGFMASLAEDRIPIEVLLSSLRWGTAEWAYEARGDDAFAPVYALLNAGDGSADTGDLAALRGGVFAAMVLGLKDLDAEGFFGAGGARDRVTLLCSVSDSESAVWLEEESARRLNPPRVYRTFWGDRTRDREVAKAYRRHRWWGRWLGGTHRAFVRHMTAAGRTGTASGG